MRGEVLGAGLHEVGEGGYVVVAVGPPRAMAVKQVKYVSGAAQVAVVLYRAPVDLKAAVTSLHHEQHR